MGRSCFQQRTLEREQGSREQGSRRCSQPTANPAMRQDMLHLTWMLHQKLYSLTRPNTKFLQYFCPREQCSFPDRAASLLAWYLLMVIRELFSTSLWEGYIGSRGSLSFRFSTTLSIKISPTAKMRFLQIC